MKLKRLGLLLILLGAAAALFALGAAPKSSAPVPAASEADAAEKIIEIKEKLFLAQTDDIYINAKDYLGKTIKYEGFLDIYQDRKGQKTYYVIRRSPGCCGNDGVAGFEVRWEGAFPKQNDWVEVIGVLQIQDEGGMPYLWIKLKSLKVLQKRGAEFVTT